MVPIQIDILRVRGLGEHDYSQFSTTELNGSVCLSIAFHADPRKSARKWFHFPLWSSMEWNGIQMR